MSDFAPTEARLDVTRAKYPGFPREPAVLVRLIKHIYKEVHDEANAVTKPFGLNHPEYNILMMLYGSPDSAMNPSQLAEAAGEKSANITRLTTQLCDKGYIVRTGSDEDRRKVTLTLTPEGLELIESFLPDIVTLLHRQTRNLQPSEQALLEGLLKKMLAGFGE
ncbi:MarR family transcriptional regulator [Luteibacter sp. 22Crub2.1]|uniref:MarR family winged helix-turn-helix transcriptional regulator n=1 Tax=Luteibacter sp. 22Crub2.1 TaxID=1283288 RepID=UPI0009A60445|nr:MarR family transcriptional regulator [Luteibacter sp. 22Crub2.1]SKB85397.1 transcriptional regulator, MarR family [Luteibacter sp. 22Crub2.1]